MKRILSIIAVFTTLSVAAQKIENAKSQEKEKNKIETIKIVNGDTVFHEIRIVSGDLTRNEHKMKKHMYYEMSDKEMSDEIEEILKEINIYINLDDHKKRMIIHKMKMNDEDFEDFIGKWDEGSDMIIDMRSGKNQLKIIKIEINDEDGEEVKVIEIHKDRRMEKERYEIERRERRSSNRPDPLKVFPNPAEDELNLEFEVMEGKPAELIIMDVKGNKIFDKTYTKAGKVQEKIKLNEDLKGLIIIRLLDQNRTISKSIIIE